MGALHQVGASFRARPLEGVVCGVALLVVGFQAALRLQACSELSVHWDEFNFLRYVHAAHRGEAIARFQTLHARLFFWLPYVGEDEVAQIVVARQVMWLLNMAALAALAAVARRFHGWTATLCSLSIVGSASYVIQHACAFRYDGLLLPLYALALWLFLRPSLTAATLAGAGLAAAPLFSLKSVLFAPPLALFAVFGRGSQLSPGTLRYVLRCAAAAVASFCLLAALHWSRGKSGAGGERAVGDYAAGMFAFRLPLLRYGIIEDTWRADPAVWFLALAGGLLLLAATLKPQLEERQRAGLIFLAGAPLLTILVYRNAWPYYIAGVLMAGVLWVAVAPAQLLRSPLRPARAAVLLGLLGLSLYGGINAYAWHLGIDTRTISEQRRLIAGVKTVFPSPVPYIDRCGMIASYPKVNRFITSLTAGRYQARGEPQFEDLLRRTQPPLLLANVGSLNLNREWRSGSHALLRPDFEVLRANFIHHWGPIWVAGKELTLQAEQDAVFEIQIAGTYTVESAQPLVLDGRPVQPGQTVQLAQSAHSARAEHAGSARLRYGDHLPIPSGRLPSKKLFDDFGSQRPRPLF